MQRILILGPSGSGKSYLGRMLGVKLDLNILHLDYYFWKPDWKTPTSEKWNEILVNLLNKRKWVMDGNYANTLELRCKFADTVIFLECNRFRCLKRCWFRFLKYRGKTRPDMNSGCKEKFDWEFVKWIWNFTRDIEPEILRIIENSEGIKFLKLKDRKEIDNFLDNL